MADKSGKFEVNANMSFGKGFMTLEAHAKTKKEVESNDYLG